MLERVVIYMREIICLMNNGKIKNVDEDKLEDVVDKHKVQYVLFPIGIYSNQYCIVKPENIPFGTKALQFDYRLFLQAFGDDNPCYENITDSCMSTQGKKNILTQIYRMIHSIYKINAANIIYNNEFADELYMLIIDGFIVHIKDKKGTITEYDSRCISSREVYPYTTYSNTIDTHIPYIMYSIDSAFGRKPGSENSLIYPVNHKEIFVIDRETEEWMKVKSTNKLLKAFSNTNKHINNIMVSNVDITFNSLTFILASDLVAYSMLTHMSFGFVSLYCSDIDFEDSDIMSASSVYDLYDNILLVKSQFVDKSVDIYETSTLIEILSNFKYILQCIELINDTLWGFTNKTILYVNATLEIPDSKTGKSHKQEVMYSICNEEGYMNDGRDYVNEFSSILEELLIPWN